MTYGCYNRPAFKAWHWAEDKEYRPDGGPTFPVKVKVPFRMDKDCKYSLTDLGKHDPKCFGCARKQTE